MSDYTLIREGAEAYVEHCHRDGRYPGALEEALKNFKVERLPSPVTHPPLWVDKPLHILHIAQPLCEDTVRLSGTGTNVRQARQARAAALGLPVDRCGKPAVYRVGARALCFAHAGRVVLEALSDKA